MDEQLFIMLRRSASADGQWRGQANCDANLCSRIIKIAKIGPQRCSNGAREKMKLFMIGEPFHESDEGGSRRPLSAYGVVVLTEFSPCRQTPIRWQLGMHDEAGGRAPNWSKTIPTGRWREFDCGRQLEIDLDCRETSTTWNIEGKNRASHRIVGDIVSYKRRRQIHARWP